MRHDHGFDALLAEMKKRSTGCWDWEKAHLVLTDVGAEREPWGALALELTEVDEKTVKYTVHCLVSIVGHEVCLNLPKEAEEAPEKRLSIRDVYLKKAPARIHEMGMNGYWDGHDWILLQKLDTEARLMLDAEGHVLVEPTVDAMEAAARPAIEGWEVELAYLHEALDNLAGWKDRDGNDVPEGTVVEGSACWLWQQQT